MQYPGIGEPRRISSLSDTCGCHNYSRSGMRLLTYPDEDHTETMSVLMRYPIGPRGFSLGSRIIRARVGPGFHPMYEQAHNRTQLSPKLGTFTLLYASHSLTFSFCKITIRCTTNAVTLTSTVGMVPLRRVLHGLHYIGHIVLPSAGVSFLIHFYVDENVEIR